MRSPSHKGLHCEISLQMVTLRPPSMEDYIVELRATYDKLWKGDSAGIRTDNVPMQDPLYDSDDTEASPPQKRVQKMIGMALWVARNARPDVSYAVSRLGTRVARWSKECDTELCRLVRYLFRTRALVLRMTFAKEDQGAAQLSVYSDANLAYPASQSGHIVCLESENGTFAPLVWRSVKQPLCVDSSGASELIAAHLAVKDNILFANSVQPGTLLLRVDNSAVIRNCARGTSANLSWLSMAVKLRVGMLRDLREQGLIRVEYVPTKENLADAFSKALQRVKIEEQRE